ncbi:Imm1 family immunity protein [Streptomyces sp. NBC_00053]|uniref:Imm1 family immunity protein n=1 Tax=unclassified Streptomyces TaxID=2593676 RepID=UPI000F5B9D1E|nr:MULTISPECIES: Imm1 family immunity protein [unclassified Streptomyces]WSG53608.1 Imm1 family immunity protein [Streptomyces sp. NBC_01732]WSX04263.1 Imm1 family immunity protein [Streptomyces sp. NBC_00987]MCX5105614.1 Imm1 family immunity protein [Streptomyces sp. NBC_00439]MCX5163239.1 Imm1 family immunity protein [Streptomyces sp. NBC_00305]MCX5221763.1 Imm1 family immunity protein [Streptomyces sp. NBC_00264]
MLDKELLKIANERLREAGITRGVSTSARASDAEQKFAAIMIRDDMKKAEFIIDNLQAHAGSRWVVIKYSTPCWAKRTNSTLAERARWLKLVNVRKWPCRDGWKVTHDRVQAYYREQHADEPLVVRTPEDVDALIDALANGPEFENLAVLHSSERELLPSGFPDHEFMVGADGERQVGVLSFMDEKNFVSLGSSGSGGAEVSYFVVENPTEFPATAEIPLALVRQAAKEFLSSGGRRPMCVQWQEPEVW